MLKQCYDKYIRENGYTKDLAQLGLIDLLSGYQKKVQSNRLLSIFLGPVVKKGVYIWGDVGRGKTFISSLFFDSLSIEQKYKQHFHQFMLDCHSEIQQNPSEDHALKNLTNMLIAKYRVLYLDEFQINNIADAMLLSRLFTILMDSGMYIFLTSNTKPAEIYKDGLKREYILPFINFIQENLNVYNLSSPRDYRREKLKAHKNLFIYPLINSESKLTTIINDLVGSGKFEKTTIQVTSNRLFEVKNSCGVVARFTFEELCVEALGAADYLALCRSFDMIIITNIPQLRFEDHNQILRFITLVDCMYDNRIMGVFTAEAPLEDLYLGDIHRNEFQRTISRIYEMQSEEYDKHILQ
ncbi:cell division protein ZapE [Candidatus Bandiella euplotis]|uniref:Cell division protein ZapE n=1 Tax=Candidatus Bandiella euplotis TaxID=1664265 RepID=A0ABZ0UPT9_9RICK|nr:cell division protein ZapE [Candidatus Bandiella woodruffii]WPX97143.1 Putative cell division protein ZapE [Candidatus Bandiella woodruffii]